MKIIIEYENQEETLQAHHLMMSLNQNFEITVKPSRDYFTTISKR